MAKDEFIPLKTSWGISASEFCRNLDDKCIIWGAGVLGKKIAHRFIKEGLGSMIYGFFDANLEGSQVKVADYKFPCVAENVAFPNNQLSSTPLVLASESALKSMEKICIERGMAKGIDYFSYRVLNRPEAVINIGQEYYPVGTGRKVECKEPMSISDFMMLVEFLEGMPGLFGIELGGNTDAAACLFIDDAIKLCSRIAPTSVIFYSVERQVVNRIIEASPLQAVLVLDKTNLRDFNLSSFKSLIKKFACSALSIEFRVRVDLYKGDDHELIREVTKVCTDNHVKVIKTPGYGFDYGQLHADGLAYINDQLIWDLEEAMAGAYRSRGKPCLCQRLFPVVDQNLDIQTCHLYSRKAVGNLKTMETYADAIEMRANSAECVTCQKRGLHRLDIDVLRVNSEI